MASRGNLVTEHPWPHMAGLVTESGKPAAGITLRWRPAGDAGTESQWDYDTTNHHGLLELRLAPGRWAVEAFDDAWASKVRTEVAVTEGVAMERSFVVPAR